MKYHWISTHSTNNQIAGTVRSKNTEFNSQTEKIEAMHSACGSSIHTIRSHSRVAEAASSGACNKTVMDILIIKDNALWKVIYLFHFHVYYAWYCQIIVLRLIIKYLNKYFDKISLYVSIQLCPHKTENECISAQDSKLISKFIFSYHEL